METPIEQSATSNDFMSEPARPQFLSVICILTWVCCGFMFITTVWNVLFQQSPEQQMEQIEKIRQLNPEAAEQMELALENQSQSFKTINTLLTLIALALTAFGTWMMWNLKKNGFYFYLAGEFLPYLAFFMGGAEAMSSMSAMTGMSASAVLGITIAVMALFDGVFIAMYAANTKHMIKA